MKILLVTLIFLTSFTASANHLLGGEIYYDYIGNDQYVVTLNVFRDCNDGKIPLDNPMDVTAFAADTVFQLRTFMLIGPPTVISGNNSDPCIIPPPGLCVERGTYRDTLTLPMNADGYYIVYQRGNWSGDIVNMVDPTDRGLNLVCYVPGTEAVATQNNAVRFNNEPPLLHCSGKEILFDHSATDPDGDSLVYSLCDPTDFVAQGASFDPTPEQEGPYVPIPWAAGYDAMTPLGAGATFTLDSITGELTSAPDATGTFNTGICVSEYRNDTLININVRTFNFIVVSCDIIIPFTISAEGVGNVFADPDVLGEDCADSKRPIYFSRLEDVDTLVIGIKTSGTAINGVDYNLLPDSLVMLPGTLKDTIILRAYLDGIEEDVEDARIVFSYFDICNDDIDSVSLDLQIIDYQPMALDLYEDSVNICPDEGEYVELTSKFSGGIEPYNFQWQAVGPGSIYPNSPSLLVPNSDIENLRNPFYLTITDFCSKSITSDTTVIYNQCPIIVPNVVTMNDDGINEVFIIKNRFDYAGIEFRVFTRWGEEIYESSNYKNDWNITDKTGEILGEGVYFYTIKVVNDTKYQYSDVEEILYTKQGFFHVLNSYKE